MPVLNRASTSGVVGWLSRAVGGVVSRGGGHPLGPLLWVGAAARPLRARLLGGLALLGCCGVFGVAATVTPSADGLGSHEQLGLGRCGVLTLTGYPCPTCGMTTAFAHAVRGELMSAFSAQPAGVVLAAAVAVVVAFAAHVVVTGRIWRVNWYRVSPVWVPVFLAGLIVVGWVYKLVAGVGTGRLPFHAV